ncbi:hypothetical protein ABUW04_37595 [Streptacidiphilus sp. N1-10]|uniref:Uncharacterized protein n=1 Tax=Streptacidiphilus jeojiensis TaxID=3229225 RepID=A0ABV6Y0U7_9ACTN
MSSLSDLQDALQQIQRSTPMVGRFMFDSLPGAIGQALAVPGPPGSPSAVDAQAEDYRKAGAQAAVVEADLTHVSSSALPRAWTGPVAETAAQAVASVAAEVATTVTVLGQAAAAMAQWSAELSAAQTLDRSGTAELTAAQQQPMSQFDAAKQAAVPMDIGGDVKQPDGSTKWEGHQVMIIGASGDQLEVYNPWGSTSWISTSDYVNGNVGSITGTTMNTPFHVEIPKQ